MALTSPKDAGAPIPFHLSPNIGPVSPVSPARCTSSPDFCTTPHDSFADAFTSIKTTDDSESSSPFHISEEIGNSINIQSRQSKSSFAESLSANSSFSCEQTECGANKSVGENLSPREDVQAGLQISCDTKHLSPDQSSENASCDMVTPEQKLKVLTPTSKEQKRTRFQSIVRSHSATFERDSLKTSNMPGSCNKQILQLLNWCRYLF